MREADVVVVGAGIGGAVLALALARRGWSVLVVEKESQPRTIVRPEILWRATPQRLDAIGIGDAVRQVSVPLQGIEMRLGAEAPPILEIGPADLARASAEAWSTDPTLTRIRILDAALASGRVRLERGVEVRELLRENARVVGVRGEGFECRARLVVGDDGVHSAVRGALGADIDLTLFPLEFVTALIAWPGHLSEHKVCLWVNPSRLGRGLAFAVFFPWPERRGVMLLPLSHRGADELFAGGAQRFWEALTAVTPLGAELSKQIVFPRDFTRVRRPFGHASTYVGDGVALIGDAIHPMSPAGGQGANASISDALALAEVADEALRADDLTAPRLAAFEHRRRAANDRSVGISRRANQFLRMARRVPVPAAFVPMALRRFNRSGGGKAAVIRYFSTAFCEV